VVFLAKGEPNTMDTILISLIPLFIFLPSLVDPINNREVQGLYLLDQFGVGRCASIGFSGTLGEGENMPQRVTNIDNPHGRH